MTNVNTTSRIGNTSLFLDTVIDSDYAVLIVYRGDIILKEGEVSPTVRIKLAVMDGQVEVNHQAVSDQITAITDHLVSEVRRFEGYEEFRDVLIGAIRRLNDTDVGEFPRRRTHEELAMLVANSLTGE